MTAGRPEVSVIIPTLGLRERAGSLQASIESALGQEGVRVTVIVVLNGQHRCAEIERALRADPRVTLVLRQARGLPPALVAGRAVVETPWFSALDDDDLLLPGALELRVRELEARRECAAVVTNGYIRTDAGDALHMASDATINDDPMRAMLQKNWCLPGSWLCRSDMIGIELFEDMPSYLECTYLALRIASEHRIHWIDTPTVIYRVGSPSAESLSRAYVVGQVRALRRIIQLKLPDDVRAELRSRICGAYHAAADHDRNAGATGQAWRWHLASLVQPSGWRYAPFTRHLLRDAFRDRS